jgi:ABC-type multidrug transport system fused ATPase/permease subunit
MPADLVVLRGVSFSYGGPPVLSDIDLTIRERDTLAQIRVPVEGLEKVIEAKLKGEAFDASTLWATRQK